METMIPATLQDNADESLDMARLGAQLHEMTALYGQSRERIAQLEEQISQLQRRLFGARSERYEANQFVMDLILKAGESATPVAVEPVVDVKATPPRTHRDSRAPCAQKMRLAAISAKKEWKTDSSTDRVCAMYEINHHNPCRAD